MTLGNEYVELIAIIEPEATADEVTRSDSCATTLFMMTSVAMALKNVFNFIQISNQLLIIIEMI